MMAKVNALRELQSPSLHFGDCRFAECAIRRRGRLEGLGLSIVPGIKTTSRESEN
jgi:hypothetical protein